MGAIRFSFLFASLELWFDLFSDYGPVIFWIYWVWICFKNIWDHARSIFFVVWGWGVGFQRPMLVQVMPISSRLVGYLRLRVLFI